MLNYSCYGTYVNNILFSNDETNKYIKKEEKKSPCLESQVREIVDKKRKINRSKKSLVDSKMVALDNVDRMECCCVPSNYEALTAGWEGPAIVTHGALLRFGCICFVFSIVDRANL